MSAQTIRWYSLDSDMKACEHPPVDLDRAIEIVEDYYARGAGKFETVEDALRATMFGFSRSKTEFIEICVLGPSQIAYRFELADPRAPLLRRMVGGTFQFEAELRSKAELIERVKEFFALAPAAIKARLESA
jgi:hypothetical protein